MFILFTLLLLGDWLTFLSLQNVFLGVVWHLGFLVPSQEV